MLGKHTTYFCLSLSCLIIALMICDYLFRRCRRGKFTCLQTCPPWQTLSVKCSFSISDCRSTSRATRCRVPTWRRPHPGLPGRPSTSPTTAGTTSSASATLAKPASRTPACWKSAGRGSRCATAPATDPPAAPLTVSARDRWSLSSYLSLWMFLLSRSNWLSASLQASYWPPGLEPFLLSVCCSLDPSFCKLFPLSLSCKSWRSAILISCLRSLTLSELYQSIRHVNELPIHKADQQFTTNFSSVSHSYTNRCMHKVQLQPWKETQTHSLSIIPVIPSCPSQCTTQSQSATPLVN